MTDIDPVSQSLGRIEQKVDDLVKGFNNLPCSIHDKAIKKVVAYQNKQIGVIATIGILMGFLGWLLSPLVDWIMKHLIK